MILTKVMSESLIVIILHCLSLWIQIRLWLRIIFICLHLGGMVYDRSGSHSRGRGLEAEGDLDVMRRTLMGRLMTLRQCLSQE